ncbi:MAG TPA: MFS transporter, partial [Paracoccaceae bacterium]|nr:MFS transporter [Paracoccaceae bacterium]
MLTVLRNSWALLLGIMLLMLGNGIQGTLLGIRGKIEGFSPLEMSGVMSAYYLGFLFGSRLAPKMIRRVGHVRVFAALGSLVSAVLILYPVAPDWMAWILMRVVVGFCFSGIYITSESWLNASSTNETRGQALSAYMIMQMVGVIAAQALLNLRDPGGFDLFVISSILVSIAFTPILLSSSAAPSFEKTTPLSMKKLFHTSPLACVGMFLMGGVFATQFGMASVWGSEVGLSVKNLSIFVGSIYVGGLVLQYPIGWLSDRIDRRTLIAWLSAFGAVAVFLGTVLPWTLLVLVAI